MAFLRQRRKTCRRLGQAGRVANIGNGLLAGGTGALVSQTLVMMAAMWLVVSTQLPACHILRLMPLPPSLPFSPPPVSSFFPSLRVSVRARAGTEANQPVLPGRSPSRAARRRSPSAWEAALPCPQTDGHEPSGLACEGSNLRPWSADQPAHYDARRGLKTTSPI